MSGERVRVLIVDDQPLFADALKHLLETDPTLEIVGVAGDGEAAVDLALAENAEVILMDIGLPRLDGFEATRKLLGLQRAAKVIAVTGRTEAEVGEQARAAGMISYLSKDLIHEHVREAIEAARNGTAAWNVAATSRDD